MLTETKAHRPAPIPDRRLDLLFACTHPGLDTAVQTPLMLQAVLGLPADRIASAFLMTPAALGQRLSRAKARLKDMRAAFEAPEPDDLPARLPQVMDAVLAVASLGCKAVPGSDPARADLASEATQLAEVLAHLTPHQTEPLALLSLILHVMARAQARRAGLCP
ncbi:MAG: DUF6596 domain-containing protein [Gemmobacter sp.]